MSRQEVVWTNYEEAHLNMENKGGVSHLIKKPSKSDMDRKEILIFQESEV